MIVKLGFDLYFKIKYDQSYELNYGFKLEEGRAPAGGGGGGI